MNCNLVAPQHPPAPCRLIKRAACLVPLVWCSTFMFAQTPGGAASPAAPSEIHVTHVLGFEGAPHNAAGKLSIQDSGLQFRRGEDPAYQASIASIQDVAVGEEDKQVGGLPMTLGKAATPYGGGRVISLFSHKKYDTLAVQYLDSNGALHGAVFRLAKGQGEAFKAQLVAKGAHVVSAENEKQNTPEVPQ